MDILPRLAHEPRHERPNPPPSRKKRKLITSACRRCRQKKARCDGARPACTGCIRQGHECEYEHGVEPGETRHAALKRELGQANQRLGELTMAAELLKSVSSKDLNEIVLALRDADDPGEALITLSQTMLAKTTGRNSDNIPTVSARHRAPIGKLCKEQSSVRLSTVGPNATQAASVELALLDTQSLALTSTSDTNLATDSNIDNGPDSFATASLSAGSFSASPSSGEYVDTVQRPLDRRSTASTTPYGRASGFEVFRRLRILCGELVGLPYVGEQSRVAGIMSSLDVPLSSQKLSYGLGPVTFPSQAEVLFWVDVAFREAFCLRPFVERAAVEHIIHRWFQGDGDSPDNNENEDNLALLHIVVALGQRYDTTPLGPDEIDRSSLKRNVAGLKHFIAATRIIDTSNCGRSVVALQTMLCSAIFAKAANAHSLCHSYASTAANAALRMGLHEPSDADTPHVQGLKTRLWSTVRVVDICTTCLLGIPSQTNLQHTPDIEGQRYPPLPDPRDNFDLLSSNAHSLLCDILSQIVATSYASSSQARKQGGERSIDTQGIQQIERRLWQWSQEFAPAIHVPLERLSRQQLLLRLSFEHARLLLYSPFVHHAAQPSTSTSQSALDFACGCILAATRLVQVMRALDIQGALNIAHPLIVHSLAFSSLVLLFAELATTERSDDFYQRDIGDTSDTAKALLERLSLRCPAVATCLESLKPLYLCVDRRDRLTSSRDTELRLMPVSNMNAHVHTASAGHLPNMDIMIADFTPQELSWTTMHVDPFNYDLQTDTWTAK